MFKSWLVIGSFGIFLYIVITKNFEYNMWDIYTYGILALVISIVLFMIYISYTQVWIDNEVAKKNEIEKKI